MILDLKKKGDLWDEHDENGVYLSLSEVVEEFHDDRHVDSLSRNSNTKNSTEWLKHLIGVEDYIRDRNGHFILQKQLEEHIWRRKGNEKRSRFL